MQINRAANLAYDSVLALVYPQSCEVCGGSVESRTLGVACADCWRATRLFTGEEASCWKCGQPLTVSLNSVRPEETRCRRCDEDHFTAARAAGVYEGALRASVLALKHSPQLCARLVDLLAEVQMRAPLNRATRILPVPLHPERERGRGFNQAALIARALSRKLSLPLDEVSLVRAVHTNRHRAGMDPLGRRATVADAFRVSYPSLIAGERVLLVDDVFTTGATVSSCAQALTTAGAVEVFVLTIARPLRT